MPKITLDRFYPYSIDKVWDALTNPEALSEWLMASENLKLELGQEFRFKTKPSVGFDGIVNCKIIELQSPNKISYHWQANSMKNPTTVSWTLESVEGGTSVHLEHSGFEGLGGRMVYYILKSGWKKLLSKELLLYLDKNKTSEMI